MEENNRYTDLDKLFQENLSGNDQSGFDIPDDIVLEQALASLPKKNKRRGFLILFFGLFVLVSGAFFFMSDQNQKEYEALSAKAVFEKTISTGEEVVLNKSNDFSSANETTEEEGLKSDNEISENQIKPVAPTKPLKYSNNYYAPEIEESVIQENLNLVNEYSEPLTFIPEEKEIERIDITPISLVPITTLEVDKWSTEASFAELSPKDNFEKKISFFAFAEVLYTQFSMSNNNGQVVSELLGYDRNYLGFRTGIGAGHALSDRFNLDYQISYSRITNQSNYKSEMTYDSSKEYIGEEGSLMYADDMSTQTPIGVLNRSLVFDTETTGLYENETMLAKTNTNQVYGLLSLGVMASYHLADIGPLQIHPTLGLRSSYLVGLNHTTDVEMYYKGEMFFTDEFSGQEKTMVNKTLFSGEIGLSVSYPITKNLMTSMRFGYEQNFNSIRKSNPLDLTKTTFNSYYLGLNTRYSF